MTSDPRKHERAENGAPDDVRGSVSIDDLILRYLEGKATETEVAQLNAAMQSHRAVRQRFVALSLHARCLAELTTHASPLKPGDAVRGLVPGRSPIPVSPAGAPIYRKGHEPNSEISNFQFSIFNFQFQLLAAALLAACGLAIYLLAFNADPSDIEHRPSNIEHPPLATLIESTPGSHLTTPGGFISEGRDYPRGEYALDTGTAEFMLTNSVNVRLRGESRLHMHNDMNVSLAQGSAEFVCPKDAKGFTVRLPGGAKVIDLGTEFGVDVDGHGRILVDVREGRVRLDADRDYELTTGQSVRIDAADARVDRDLIIDGTMIWDLRPAVTVTMDSVDSGRLFVKTNKAPTDDAELRIVGGGTLYVRSTGNLAFRLGHLRGNGTGTLAIHDGSTVRVDRPIHASGDGGFIELADAGSALLWLDSLGHFVDEDTASLRVTADAGADGLVPVRIGGQPIRLTGLDPNATLSPVVIDGLRYQAIRALPSHHTHTIKPRADVPHAGTLSDPGLETGANR